jgi:hypothetical protein
VLGIRNAVTRSYTEDFLKMFVESNRLVYISGINDTAYERVTEGVW